MYKRQEIDSMERHSLFIKTKLIMVSYQIDTTYFTIIMTTVIMEINIVQQFLHALLEIETDTDLNALWQYC